MTKKQDKNKGQTGRWIEEENLNYQARKIWARINETAQIAERNFWEYISGSFPEVANMKPPTEAASGFSKACRDAVMAWYLANSEIDEKLVTLIKSDQIKPHEKKVIIGQNVRGWWAANPGPAIKAQDIDKVEVMISAVPDKERLIKFLNDLGYKQENILEGILKL